MTPRIIKHRVHLGEDLRNKKPASVCYGQVRAVDVKQRFMAIHAANPAWPVERARARAYIDVAKGVRP